MFLYVSKYHYIRIKVHNSDSVKGREGGRLSITMKILYFVLEYEPFFFQQTVNVNKIQRHTNLQNFVFVLKINSFKLFH